MTDEPIRAAQRWAGSTAGDYPLRSTATAEGKAPIATSVAPSYGGELDRWNPDDLFGAALSACMMYTFLAIARKARLDVRAFDDEVEVFLVTEDRRTRIERAVLSPTITIAAGQDPERARSLYRKAHRYCIISNSTTAEVVLEPSVAVLPE